LSSKKQEVCTNKHPKKAEAAATYDTLAVSDSTLQQIGPPYFCCLWNIEFALVLFEKIRTSDGAMLQNKTNPLGTVATRSNAADNMTT
jgi:hypothetical protein